MTRADPNFSRAANKVIRELEAEISDYKSHLEAADFLWARAEKAEKQMDEQYAVILALGKRAGIAEARVAELQTANGILHRRREAREREESE